MYKLLCSLIFLCLFSSCEDYKNINGTLKKIVNLGEKKYHFATLGTGVAAPSDIKYFILVFQTQDPYDVDAARKLVVDFTEDYIKLINESPDVHQYIENPPVSAGNIDLTIIFKDSNDKYVKALPGIHLEFGEISFLKLKFANGGFEVRFVEDYNEAYFKVYGSSKPN